MNKKTHVAFQPTISGLVISMLVLSMVIVTMAQFGSGIQAGYNISDNISITSYDKTLELQEHLRDIEESTNIQQQEGALDVIGGFFSSGYSALKIAILSFGTFENVNSQIKSDVPEIASLMTYFYWIIFTAIILGLAMAVLLKAKT